MSSEKFLGKRGASDTFFQQEDNVDLDTSFQQCEKRQSYHTRKQMRGKNNLMSKVRPKSIGMWDISNIPVSNQYYSY